MSIIPVCEEMGAFLTAQSMRNALMMNKNRKYKSLKTRRILC
jgi:hypothetical protein